MCHLQRTNIATKSLISLEWCTIYKLFISTHFLRSILYDIHYFYVFVHIVNPLVKNFIVYVFSKFFIQQIHNSGHGYSKIRQVGVKFCSMKIFFLQNNSFCIFRFPRCIYEKYKLSLVVSLEDKHAKRKLVETLIEKAKIKKLKSILHMHVHK